MPKRIIITLNLLLNFTVGILLFSRCEKWDLPRLNDSYQPYYKLTLLNFDSISSFGCCDAIATTVIDSNICFLNKTSIDPLNILTLHNFSIPENKWYVKGKINLPTAFAIVRSNSGYSNFIIRADTLPHVVYYYDLNSNSVSEYDTVPYSVSNNYDRNLMCTSYDNTFFLVQNGNYCEFWKYNPFFKSWSLTTSTYLNFFKVRDFFAIDDTIYFTEETTFWSYNLTTNQYKNLPSLPFINGSLTTNGKSIFYLHSPDIYKLNMQNFEWDKVYTHPENFYLGQDKLNDIILKKDVFMFTIVPHLFSQSNLYVYKFESVD